MLSKETLGLRLSDRHGRHWGHVSDIPVPYIKNSLQLTYWKVFSDKFAFAYRLAVDL